MVGKFELLQRFSLQQQTIVLVINIDWVQHPALKHIVEAVPSVSPPLFIISMPKYDSIFF